MFVPSLRLLRLVQDPTPHPQTVNSAPELARLLAPFLRPQTREHFLAVPLNAKHQPLGCHVVSIGTVSASLVHPREVFVPAILSGASSLVVAHNHPSGDPSPSREDREITARLRSAGDIIGIGLIDHLVLGDQAFFSFAEGQTLPYPKEES